MPRTVDWRITGCSHGEWWTAAPTNKGSSPSSISVRLRPSLPARSGALAGDGRILPCPPASSLWRPAGNPDGWPVVMEHHSTTKLLTSVHGATGRPRLWTPTGQIYIPQGTSGKAVVQPGEVRAESWVRGSWLCQFPRMTPPECWTPSYLCSHGGLRRCSRFTWRLVGLRRGSRTTRAD
jgi:hypothetical protein